MSGNAATIKGVIRGKTVELEQGTGLPDGQSVEVVIRPAETPRSKPGEGLREAFGAWADDGAELDQFLEWNRQQRKARRPELEP